MSIPLAIENVRQSFLSKKNVVGLGVGEKWVNGVNTFEPALLVFVKAKEGTESLHSHDLIPSTVNGIKTDVVGKSGTIIAHTNNARVRPIQPGYSCGHTAVTAGTIGAFFRDSDGDIVGLSNNHVVANINKGVPGNPIVQPGVYDDPNWSGNVVGTLKHFRPLAGRGQSSFNAADWQGISGYNLEDSGIFRVSDINGYTSNITGIGELNDFRDSVNIGETLQKVGRTTGLTSANVIATGATVTVGYGGSLTYEFRDQIVAGAMSQGGDSGSIVVDSSRNAVGLLFAGSDTMTIMNRIRYPRASWGLQIVHSINLVETLTYTVVVDGVTQVNSYAEADFAKALSDARSLARTGKSVTVTTSFSTHQ